MYPLKCSSTCWGLGVHTPFTVGSLSGFSLISLAEVHKCTSAFARVPISFGAVLFFKRFSSSRKLFAAETMHFCVFSPCRCYLFDSSADCHWVNWILYRHIFGFQSHQHPAQFPFLWWTLSRSFWRTLARKLEISDHMLLRPPGSRIVPNREHAFLMAPTCFSDVVKLILVMILFVRTIEINHYGPSKLVDRLVLSLTRMSLELCGIRMPIVSIRVYSVSQATFLGFAESISA